MSKFAFIFPGQASQEVGMGQDLYQQFVRVRELYDAAEIYLQFPLKKFSFEGPLEELTQTRITQPAIFIMSCAVDFLLKDKGLFPGAAAGHSLGEFSALVSAEALTFEQGLKLVKLRGELMQKASEISPGTMAAIIGLEAGKVEEICASTPGTVTPANYNSPGQLVISGEIEAVEKAMSRCLDQGAKIVKKLLVSGAFHSPLMETACTELFQALEETEFSPPKFPVYHNVTSEPAKTTFEIRELLKKQLLNPVKWEASIRNMLANADTFLEVGPGNVLSGLMKRIEHNVKVISVKNMETLNSINLN